MIIIKTGKFLHKIFLCIVLVFPFLLACVFSFILTFISWDNIGWINHDRQYFFIPDLDYKLLAIVCIIILAGLPLILIHLINNLCEQKFITNNHKVYIMSVVLYTVAFIYRFFYLLLAIFDNSEIIPFSDFQQVWGLANGDMSVLAYKSLFASWMNFAALEHVFVEVFGDRYVLFLFFNVVISSLSAPLLYKIIQEIFNKDIKSDNIALIGSMIYAIYPASAIFVTNGAPDIYVVPLYVVAIWFILVCDRYRTKGFTVSILFAALAGVFCGLSAALKSFAIVIIIAWIIVEIVRFFKNYKIGIRKIVLFSMCLLALLGTYKITKNTVLQWSENTFDVELNYDTATAHYLLIGLNTEGEGQIHVGSLSRSFYRYVLEDGMTVDEAKDKTINLLQEDWSNNKDKIIPLFIKKMIWAWQDDTIPTRYYSEYVLDTSNTAFESIFKAVLPTYAQIFYMFLVTFAAVGTIAAIRKYSDNEGLLFIALVIIGYFCIVFFSESQSRYKYLIVPMICIFDGIGFYLTFQFVMNFFGRLKFFEKGERLSK